MRKDLQIEFIKKVAATNPDMLIAELLDCYDIIGKLSEENGSLRRHVYELTKGVLNEDEEDRKAYTEKGSAAAGLNPDKDANKQAVPKTQNSDEDVIRRIFQTLIG